MQLPNIIFLATSFLLQQKRSIQIAESIMKKHFFALLLSLTVSSVLPASAGQIRLDFEHTPGADGILGNADDIPMPSTYLQTLGNQFASLGIIFTQGSLIQADFFNGDATNHFISSTNPIVTLSTPITGISIESYSFWDAILTAYDVNGNVVASDRFVNPSAGASFLRGTLSLTSTQSIYGFSILPTNPNYILNLDNLVLTTADAITDVPEPSSVLLFVLGLLLTRVSFTKRGQRE